MAVILAITNQKGGVGKTTMSLNLGAGLSRLGKRVLFVDMDPQCSLTYCLGGSSDGMTVMNLLLRQIQASQAIQRVEEGDLIAAHPGLSGADMTLNVTGKEFRLKEALDVLRPMYDYIILDSPPTLGVLTVNILTACDKVLIPALADVFSLQGVGQLFTTIHPVQTYCNPNLRISGIVLTRHSNRLVLNREIRQMLESAAAEMGTRVYQSTIREAVALREAEATQKSIFRYAPKSHQAEDYTKLIEEFLALEGTV